MLSNMLSSVIQDAFVKKVGTQQINAGKKALHVGFSMCVGATTDQYRVLHMYIYAPMNYVHVVVQEERIDANSKRHVKPMVHLGYHDSCWRDAIDTFLREQGDAISHFHSLLTLFDWNDVLALSEAEEEYLHLVEKHFRCWGPSHAKEKQALGVLLRDCPFDNRSVWVKSTEKVS